MNPSQSVLILNQNMDSNPYSKPKLKIKINKPVNITKENFEQYINYPKIDVSKIKKTLRPDIKINNLNNDEALDVSRLNIDNLANTTRYPNPNNARKLYCSELRLLSNNLTNILVYIDCYSQLFADEYDYQQMKYEIYLQYLNKQHN